ncbi:hypothetical protein BU16DRAFT_566193 [Lophium mytilinum]|uniref:F-box domain-containing protein n=1 Tax=Lophium mytilinum TaxID=390894 RepID=A0A6A6QCP1_9PEZI|nr:hypothetical protein BU16DRAFT_566193 [Lophium mytilinum]
MANARDDNVVAGNAVVKAPAAIPIGDTFNSSTGSGRTSPAAYIPPSNFESSSEQTTTGDPSNTEAHTIFQPPTMEKAATTTASWSHSQSTIAMPRNSASSELEPAPVIQPTTPGNPQIDHHTASNQSPAETREEEQSGTIAKKKTSEALNHIRCLPAELLLDVCSRLDFHDLKAFRGVNKCFADIGTEHLFSRVTVNFSEDSYDRFKNVCANERIAGTVRSVSIQQPLQCMSDAYKRLHWEYMDVITNHFGAWAYETQIASESERKVMEYLFLENPELFRSVLDEYENARTLGFSNAFKAKNLETEQKMRWEEGRWACWVELVAMKAKCLPNLREVTVFDWAHPAMVEGVEWSRDGASS